MKIVWNFSQKIFTNTEREMHFFLLLTTTASCILGFLAWYIIHFFALNTLSWAICFIGYPGFFVGFLGGILYLYRLND